MDGVYVCLITENIKYDNQGRVLGVFEDFEMASKSRDDFNDKYSYMIADVIEERVIRSL